ncbi:MAG: hypothetical protein JW742_08680 [Candidatus Aminicenantes bacterium]|nr:hypothetical protein [Candidatus Aminicenantes bacterium]
MAKCARCDRRKARRRCPALGAAICSLCCGQIREKDVRCPPGCEHLAPNASYQEQKVLERRDTNAGPSSSAARRAAARDERTAWLLFTIEAALHEIAARNPDFTDRDALLACGYARDKLARKERRLILPGEGPRPGNAAGETLVLALSRCRFERTVLLTGTAEAYAPHEQAAALDTVAGTIRALAGERRPGRTFLDRLAERFVPKGPAGPPKLIRPA